MFDQRYSSSLGFGGILCGSLIVALDAAALSPSLPIIERALHATTIETYWAGVAYTLGSAAFLPLFPAASNVAGRRTVSLAALFVFLIGTIICATAYHVSALLSGRVLQGIAGGGIVGMMYVVITDLFAMNGRPKAIAINGLIWLIGTSLGPIMGGGLSGSIGWRWIFWIVLPINAFALILVSMFLDINISKSRPGNVQRTRPAQDNSAATLRWKDLDYFGALLLVASLSSFLIAITCGGISWSWSSFQTLVPLVLGLAGLGAWISYEVLMPAKPLVPLKTLCDWTISISLLQIFVIGIIQFGVIFYLPLYYQNIKGYSPLTSGVALLPVTLLSGPVTMSVGNLIAKTGRYKYMILGGWLFMALGTGLYVLLNPSTSIAAWVFISAPVGAGSGILFAATAISVQAPVKAEDAAAVSGLIGFFRSIGQAIGIASGNAITLNVVKSRLSTSTISDLRNNAGEIAKGLSSTRAFKLYAQDPGAHEQLLDAYVHGLRGVWWMLFGLSCFCAVSTLLIRDVGLLGNTRNSEAEATANSSVDGGISEKPEAKVSEVCSDKII